MKKNDVVNKCNCNVIKMTKREILTRAIWKDEVTLGCMVPVIKFFAWTGVIVLMILNQ